MIKLNVIYSDNHLLLVNKPSGISTQTHDDGGVSLEEVAKAWVKQVANKPGNVFLQPIHRLDKAASGLVLFARTSKALSRLQAMMREGKIEKTYYAWVEGVPKLREATLEHYLIHGDHKAIVVSSSDPEGKKSLLKYQLIEQKEDRSLLKIDLITGRYHQIRAQLSAIGHPVVGDQKYGSHQKLKNGAIMLTHAFLSFVHPVTKEQMSFSLRQT